MATIGVPPQRAIPAMFEDEHGTQWPWVKDFIVWCVGQSDQVVHDVGLALARRNYGVEALPGVLSRWAATQSGGSALS